MNKLYKWIKDIIIRKSEPSPLMSAEIAYSVSAIHSAVPMTDVYTKYKKETLGLIKESANLGYTHKTLEFGKYITTEQREMLVSDLKELGYKVLYVDKSVILISWKID